MAANDHEQSHTHPTLRVHRPATLKVGAGFVKRLKALFQAHPQAGSDGRPSITSALFVRTVRARERGRDASKEKKVLGFAPPVQAATGAGGYGLVLPGTAAAVGDGVKFRCEMMPLARQPYEPSARLACFIFGSMSNKPGMLPEPNKLLVMSLLFV